MSHLFKSDKIEYRIIPTEVYLIKRGCAGCREKSNYESTGCFRVNANGNKLDIWLIYQCMKCKHTYNLTIFERQRHETLKENEYHNFIKNDAATALRYGLDKNLFVRNKAEIADDELNYELEKLDAIDMDLDSAVQLIIHNPYGLRIRTEKVLAEIFNISRSRAKKKLSADNPKYIGQMAILAMQKDF